MHRSRFTVEINATFKRWYFMRLKNDIFCTRKATSGLLMNSQQEGIGRLLWKYFNAPGNVMFVTFNVITFAGLVTFNSLISAQRTQFLEMKIAHAQSSIESQGEPLPENPKSKRFDDFLPKESATNLHAEKDGPLRHYNLEEVELQQKASKLRTYDSQLAKMSLFHMIYAYFLMKHVTSLETKNSNSLLWDEEVKIIKDIYPGDDDSLGLRRDKLMKYFYRTWRDEFGELFENLHKSQKFHFPDWKFYPENMRYVCASLYKSEMNSIDDFAQFYESVKTGDLKKLLRLWFSDNCSLIKPSPKGSMEEFYDELIRDSYGDDFLFGKYSSILWNPGDSRKRIFFPMYARNDVRSASMDTILNVLQGYVSLQEKKGIKHNAAIIRLISMIKKDCIMAKGANGKAVRILLPIVDDSSELVSPNLNTLNKNRDRQRCYEIVSQNPKVLKLLDRISCLGTGNGRVTPENRST